MKKTTLFLTAVFLITVLSQAQEKTRWRGENAHGIYPDKNLLDKWPDDGPDVNWVYEGLGQGYSSPTFAHGKIFVTGMVEEASYIFILSMDGKLIRKMLIGDEFAQSYPGSRSTPVVDGNLVFGFTGMGDIVCYEIDKYKKKWQINIINDLGARNIKWGFTETFLIDDNKLFVALGGEENNVVALDKNNGKLIWSCKGKGDKSAYCTPQIIDYKSYKLLVHHMENHILGIDASNGNLLWSYDWTNKWKVHANTPIYQDGYLYCFSGYGKGGIKLKLNDNGKSVEKVWENETMDSKMGGAVIIDGYIYGSGDYNRTFQCINWETGEQVYETKEISKGVTIAADGKLYTYGERGDLALINPTHEKFDLISKTRVTKGSEQHWAHPVIHKGILYVRHGNALIAYNIKK